MLERAEHYRDQARHLRQLAETVEHAETRDALLDLAKSYERLFLRFVSVATDEGKDQS